MSTTFTELKTEFNGSLVLNFLSNASAVLSFYSCMQFEEVSILQTYKMINFFFGAHEDILWLIFVSFIGQ